MSKRRWTSYEEKLLKEQLSKTGSIDGVFISGRTRISVSGKARRMGLTGDSKFADVMEQIIYNSGLSGMSIDGTKFCYTNPLRWHGDNHEMISNDTPERWLDVSWDSDNDDTQFLVSRIGVTLINKPGSLGKVTLIIAKNNGNISNIRFSTRKIDFYEIIIDIEVRDNIHLTNIIAALRLLSEVSSVERVRG